MREYTRTRPQSVRAQNILKKFGITLADYEAMMLAQGRACAICAIKEAVYGGWFDVDHNHATGAVRGLLCRRCNIALGFAKDDVGYLDRMIAYLTRAES